MNNTVHRIFKVILSVIVTTALCSTANADSECKGNTTLTINKKPLVVEIADSQRERNFGLMFRSSMGQDCGMLFVFPSKGVRTFTMRNTLIPLDIAFISASGEIKEIFSMQPGVLRYPSKVESLYALEMNVGWFEENALAVGSVVSLTKDGSSFTIDELAVQ